MHLPVLCMLFCRNCILPELCPFVSLPARSTSGLMLFTTTTIIAATISMTNYLCLLVFAMKGWLFRRPTPVLTKWQTSYYHWIQLWSQDRALYWSIHTQTEPAPVPLSNIHFTIAFFKRKHNNTLFESTLELNGKSTPDVQLLLMGCNYTTAWFDSPSPINTTSCYLWREIQLRSLTLCPSSVIF